MEVFDPSHPYYHLINVAFEDRIPLGFHVDLTYRCDLSCAHCFLEDRKRTELQLEDYVTVFRDLAELGCLFLLVSGGDIFVRDDAIEILREASRQRFDITLITHAMAIDDAVADQVAEMGVRLVASSVYHNDPDVHDRITGRPGSFHRTIAGLTRLRDRGIQICVKTPIFDLNAGAEEEMPAFARSLGATHQMGSVIRGSNDGSDELLSRNLDLDGKANVYDCVFSRWEQMTDLPVFGTSQRTCMAGHASGYLAPDGTVQPCLDYEQSAGNIREQPLREIWLHSPVFERVRAIRRHDFEGCRECGDLDICALCPAVAIREANLPTGVAPSKCQETAAVRHSFARRGGDPVQERHATPSLDGADEEPKSTQD